MKILMLCEFYDPELQFQENLLVKYLKKHGHDVLVLTSTFTSVFDYYQARHDSSVAKSIFEDHGATIVRLPYKFNLMNRIRPFVDVDAYLREFSPDLIYLHDIIPNTHEIARYVRAHAQTKVIMDIHMDYSNSGKNWISLKILHGMIRRYFLNVIRPHLSKIYPVVPQSADFMRDIYGVQSSEMELMPLGGDVDLVKRLRVDFDRNAFRKNLNVEPDDFVIVTGGKLARRKQIEILLELMEAPSMQQAKLLVVGEFPEDDPDYRKMILTAAKPLGDRVKFVGWQNNEGCYLHMLASDIAVFPASQSVMWQQSIVSGLPLIVGDTGGQDPSYLNTSENMIVLPGSQIKASKFRDALEPIMRSAELRNKMANGAQITASKLLDWNKIVEKIVRVNDDIKPEAK